MAPQDQTVAVTGATGFIGTAVLERITSSGWHARALVRPDSLKRRPCLENVTWIKGSLEDTESLIKLTAGTMALVHCAGRVRGACRRDFDSVNVHGTARLAYCCSKQDSPPRFIMLSSLAAREPMLSHYAASKLESEDILAASSEGMEWTVLRPPAVYGPGDRELLPLFQAMARGICPVPGDGNNRISLIHVYDLAEAVVQILRCSSLHAGIFELHDGSPGGYTWDNIMDTVSNITGRRIIRIKIPVAIVKMIGLINIVCSKMLGKDPMLTPGKAEELVHPDWTADNTDITSNTGWVPVITLEQGLKHLLRNAGYGA